MTEKAPCWLRVSTSGEAGHGSLPPPGLEGATTRLVAALERVRGMSFEPQVVPEVEQMFAALAAASPARDATAFSQLSAAFESDAEFRERFLAEPLNRAVVSTTLAITVLEGSTRTNVLPARATAHLDARLLPGARCEDLVEDVRATIGDPEVEIETLLTFPSRTSRTDTPLYRAIQNVARSVDPDAVVVPRVITGFTDAHYFREQGLVAYGFVPRWFHPGEARGVHGVDERISVENLERGVEMLIAILRELDRVERSRPN